MTKFNASPSDDEILKPQKLFLSLSVVELMSQWDLKAKEFSAEVSGETELIGQSNS